MKIVLYCDVVCRGGIIWEEYQNAGTLETFNSYSLLFVCHRGVVLSRGVGCQALSGGT